MVQSFAKQSEPTIAGTGVDLYVTKAFINPKPTIQPQSTQPTDYYVNVAVKKRRDIAPKAPAAGQYVVNQKPINHGKPNHFQSVSIEAFNQILKVNGLASINDDQLKSAQGAPPGHHRPIISETDNLAFRANVFSDNHHQGWDGGLTYLFNPHSIQKASQPFNFARNEIPLESMAYRQRHQKRRSKQEQHALSQTLNSMFSSQEQKRTANRNTELRHQLESVNQTNLDDQSGLSKMLNQAYHQKESELKQQHDVDLGR